MPVLLIPDPVRFLFYHPPMVFQDLLVLGMDYGVGSNLAKGSLLETGAVTAKITGRDLWQADIFAQWPVINKFGAVLSLSLSPLAFSTIGYDSAGKAITGLSYSFLNLDIAPLVSFSLHLKSGIISAMIGPLLGLRIGDGSVFLKSEDVSSTYTVPGSQMLNASLGILLSGSYSLSAGPGYIDLGLKITCHYSSAQGFLTEEATPVYIVTPCFSAGYSLRGKK